MRTKLTILFVPIDGVGHFNACIGVAEQLRDRGHHVIFAVPDGFRDKLTPQGFQEEYYRSTLEQISEDQTIWGAVVANMGTVLAKPVKEQLKELLTMFARIGLSKTKVSDAPLAEIVARTKPDIIVADWLSHQPAFMEAGIPWILSYSMSPLCISEKNLPPFASGYPTNGDRKIWEKFKDLRSSLFMDIFQEFNQWLIEQGVEPLKFQPPFFIRYSPYANIYMYPEELDYTDIRPNPPNWYRFDTFVRESDVKFEIPHQLQNKSGKLIYFSMGTIGCSELKLTRRLLSILAKSPNRFIVSKGPLGDQLELSENMWGAQTVPQLAIMSAVDLVITHGGNNTLTESFYFGKPVIVLDLFGDQHDNGQRILETGLGARFHPYHVQEAELLSAIESLLKDKVLAAKMAHISKRIQSSNSQSRAADLVEKIAWEYPVQRSD